ncbi:hypothetical protein M7775_08475 [Sporomusa sphaeroides DSM 2875]|uniref:hypothetical protein n=1 Tax=Sporomusa sphaeroides TaxID=47679 RepID=UPI002030D61F|nr:hypothetical protein [Sporomusa sphaeroides]MCM0758603.1 hypothetical protein [Sporomusa sphaeroides DSM 2875]
MKIDICGYCNCGMPKEGGDDFEGDALLKGHLFVIETGNMNKYHLHMVTDRKLPLTHFEAKEYIERGIIKSLRCGHMAIFIKKRLMVEGI